MRQASAIAIPPYDEFNHTKFDLAALSYEPGTELNQVYGESVVTQT